MLFEGKVSPQVLGDGAIGAVRLGKTGAAIVGHAHARYYEAVSRGKVFGVANQAGITTQAGLSLTTPALTLYNPAGSGVNGVLLFAGAIESIVVAAASIVWIGLNTNIAAAAVTGTATTAHRCMLAGGGGSPALSPLLAATLPAAPIAIATLGIYNALAVVSHQPYQTIGRWFDGSIVLAPGAALSFQTSTASGTAGFFGEFVWEEVPA